MGFNSAFKGLNYSVAVVSVIQIYGMVLKRKYRNTINVHKQKLYILKTKTPKEQKQNNAYWGSFTWGQAVATSS